MESPSSLHSVLQWACRDQTLADRYRRVLDVEGVQSIEDLSELTLDDMKEAGIKEVHAKKLERKCKKTKIKIAVGTKENVVGIIQVGIFHGSCRQGWGFYRMVWDSEERLIIVVCRCLVG
jgi:hypothetical protein